MGRVCTERQGSSPSLEIWCHNPTPAPEWATRTRAGLSQIFPAKADCKQDLSMIIDQEIFKNEGEMDRLLYHLLVVELLSDKFVLTEGEPGLTGH